MILNFTSLVIAQYEAKGDIQFEYSGLVGEDLIEVLYKFLRL